MIRRPLALLATIVLAALAAARPAAGVQHLVGPGDNWTSLGPKLRPGDEVILLPGLHRPATLSNVRGALDAPITIRALDPQQPPVIEAERHGLVLDGCAHVVVRDLIVTGATVTGIALTAAPESSAEAETAPPEPSGLVVRDVVVRRTGPRGERHALHVEGLRQVRIERCAFEGWGGAAIDLVGVTGATITGCTFTGDDACSQARGLRVRAGSTRVAIVDCAFDDAGAIGVSLGGASEIEAIAPGPGDPPRLVEARDVRVMHCTFRGGGVPVAFAHCIDGVVRHNTIVRPEAAVVAIADAHPEASGVEASARCIVGSNLIVLDESWTAPLAVLDGRATPAALVLEENLWWAGADEAVQATLAALVEAIPGEARWPQATGVDPRLDDETLRPAGVDPDVYGAIAAAETP